MANNIDLIGDEAAVRQILTGDFSATDGVFEDDTVTSVIANRFRNCHKLSSVKLPKVSNVGESCFNGSKLLSRADLGNVSSNGSYVFMDCTALSDLVLRRTSGVSAFGANGFTNTPIGEMHGNVYVPRNLLSNYQSAGYWNSFVADDQFKPLEDYTVDGTIEGEFDWSLIDTVETPVFSLYNQSVESGVSIDSGIQLFDTLQPKITVILDYTMLSNSGTGSNFIGCYDGNNQGLYFQRNLASQNVSVYYRRVGTTSTHYKVFDFGANGRNQLAVTVYNQMFRTYMFNNGSYKDYIYVGGSLPTETLANTFTITGKSSTKGIIHTLLVYKTALNMRQIQAVLSQL